MTQKNGAWVVYLYNERDLPNGGHMPVAEFLKRLARRERKLVATGYRTNGRQTTLTFDKSERVAISPRLQAFLSGLLAAPDDEAQRFVESFMDPRNPQFTYWLPNYRQSLAMVADAVARDAHDEIFDLVWKQPDNGISNAGQGVMSHAAADRLRPQLVDVLRNIAADGSAASFDAVVSRFEQWSASGEIYSVPRLLIARAFAAIHPARYHTTVDAEKQDRILPWFSEHTGFTSPKGSWAWKAAALTAHLESTGLDFGESGESLERRNMFPWYLYDQIRDSKGKLSFRPGHTPKVPSGIASTCAASVEIEYRHNLIQDRLYALLCERHGRNAVQTEAPTGTGGRADALVRFVDDSVELYEIKVAQRASDAVRDAMGQLLEYSYRRGGLEPKALYVVSEPAIDELTDVFLERLRNDFGLNLNYLSVCIDAAELAAQ